MNTVLKENVHPTRADFELYYGAGLEIEEELEDRVCLDRGWEPEKCAEFQQERLQHPDAVPSLFLAWLRTQVPVAPRISVKRVWHKEEFSTEYIEVSLDGISVQFLRNLDPNPVRPPFGRLCLCQIEGEDVLVLIRKELGPPRYYPEG